MPVRVLTMRVGRPGDALQSILDAPRSILDAVTSIALPTTSAQFVASRAFQTAPAGRRGRAEYARSGVEWVPGRVEYWGGGGPR